MAGDWIKMRVDLVDDPAVVLVSEAVQISEDEVVGKLHRLWSWASRHVRDGNATVSGQWLDKLVTCPGFSSALVRAGWLEINQDCVSFPKFDRHNSKSAKERALATERKRASRNGHDDTVTKPRPEKRREEKKKNTPSNPPPFDPKAISLPPDLDRPMFRQAWSDWCEYRERRKPPVTEQSAKMAIKVLNRMTAEEATSRIEMAITNGWQGLVFPEDRKRPTPPTLRAGQMFDPDREVNSF